MDEVTFHPVMRKRRGLASAILGLTLGLLLGFLIQGYKILSSGGQQRLNVYASSIPGSRPLIKPTPRNVPKLDDDEQINSSSTSLVFVGVMTASKYLDSRAKAVYETWGKELPGKIAFFSSESSVVPGNCPDLPLVPLPRVDDTYPPQKKSFMMLQYMWNNYGDRFEWFLRADDDVYVRTDRLEKLLRSVNSNRAMYIGQAGRGNSEEFGLLSLEYDENFCMGGPGVILSRETLRRIVPHVKYCLRHLYTTHEDVELGRCVQKYAGIPCTWSYEVMSPLVSLLLPFTTGVLINNAELSAKFSPVKFISRDLLFLRIVPCSRPVRSVRLIVVRITIKSIFGRPVFFSLSLSLSLYRDSSRRTMVAGDVRCSTCNLLIDTDFVRTTRYPTERNTFFVISLSRYLGNRLIVNGIEITVVSPRNFQFLRN